MVKKLYRKLKPTLVKIEVYMIIDTYDKFVDWLEKQTEPMDSTVKGWDEILEYCPASTVRCSTRERGSVFVIHFDIEQVDKNTNWLLSSLFHEVTHLVHRIMEFSDIPVNVYNTEVMAYMGDHYFSEAYHIISSAYWSKKKEETMATKKGVPKKDGSGKGKRLNKGRGGCKTTKKSGGGKK